MCSCAATEAAELRGGEDGTGTDCEHLLLLKHLSGSAGRLSEPGNAPSAARFLLTRSFAEAAAALERDGADDDAVRDALLRHRRMADQLTRSPDSGERSTSAIVAPVSAASLAECTLSGSSQTPLLRIDVSNIHVLPRLVQA